MSKVLVDRISPYTAGGRVSIDGVALKGPFFDVTHPDFGAILDGVADDSTKVQAAINFASAAGGGVVTGPPGKTWKVTTNIELKTGVILDLNGGTLNFAVVGDYECLQMRDVTEVCNGSVVVNGSALGATGGNYHCPIIVGQFTNNVGYKRVRIHDLTISTNRADGNGIMLTSSSHDIDIWNIDTPDSSSLGRLILVHWGSDGTLPPVLSTHPYDIRIANISGGAQSATTAASGIVYLSGAHNIKVSNVYVKRTGSSGAPISIVAGDYGYSYAAAAVQPMAMQGITVDGVLCEQCDGNMIVVDGWADNDAAHGSPIFSIPARITNVKGKGTGAGSTKAGVRLYKCLDTEIINCEMSHFARGADVDEATKRCKIRGGRYFNNWGHGVNVDHATTNPEDTLVEDVEAYLNGQSGTNSAGIFSGNAKRTKIVRPILGHNTPASETTQIWGVRVSGGTDCSLIDPVLRSYKTGGAGFSLGSGATTYGEIYEARGLAALSGANYRGGLDRLPVRRVPTTGNVINTHLVGPSAPTAGAWQVGDSIDFDAPTAGGKRGAVCTTAGSPGTWKSFGAIDP